MFPLMLTEGSSQEAAIDAARRPVQHINHNRSRPKTLALPLHIAGLECKMQCSVQFDIRKSTSATSILWGHTPGRYMTSLTLRCRIAMAMHGRGCARQPAANRTDRDALIRPPVALDRNTPRGYTLRRTSRGYNWVVMVNAWCQVDGCAPVLPGLLSRTRCPGPWPFGHEDQRAIWRAPRHAVIADRCNRSSGRT